MLLDDGYHVQVYDALLEPANLVGQNLGYAHAHLAEIDTLLVDKAAAESGDYALVVATNRVIRELDLGDTPVIDLSATP